jgi:uncharacterized protein YeeX (DUF496 family)
MLKNGIRLMNDPKQYEKETFGINRIKGIIKELQKMYEKTPTTEDHLLRAEIIKGIEHSKRDLSKIQAKYDIFKKYKMRTAISK